MLICLCIYLFCCISTKKAFISKVKRTARLWRNRPRKKATVVPQWLADYSLVCRWSGIDEALCSRCVAAGVDWHTNAGWQRPSDVGRLPPGNSAQTIPPCFSSGRLGFAGRAGNTVSVHAAGWRCPRLTVGQRTADAPSTPQLISCRTSVTFMSTELRQRRNNTRRFSWPFAQVPSCISNCSTDGMFIFQPGTVCLQNRMERKNNVLLYFWEGEI